jgi:hypothetical protein
MRASRFMLRCGLAALVTLTAACNAILGVNDVTEEPAAGTDAGAGAHPCDVASDFALIMAPPSVLLLSHHTADDGTSLAILLNNDTKPDGIVMELYDNMGGHGVVNAVGSYTLTTADAWLGTCAICISIFTDFDSSTSTFSQTYFAAAQGTLKLSRFDATGITGSLEGLKLRQVDLSGDSMFDVVNGCSVTIEDAEFTATWSTAISTSAPNDSVTALGAGARSSTSTHQDGGLKHRGQQP